MSFKIHSFSSSKDKLEISPRITFNLICLLAKDYPLVHTPYDLWNRFSFCFSVKAFYYYLCHKRIKAHFQYQTLRNGESVIKDHYKKIKTIIHVCTTAWFSIRYELCIYAFTFLKWATGVCMCPLYPPLSFNRAVLPSKLLILFSPFSLFFITNSNHKTLTVLL